jgi:septum formation protein
LRFGAEAEKLSVMNQGFIYLASASPRRRELLTQIGVRYRVRASGIPERREPGEAIADFARRMALAKAHAVQALTRDEPAPVLGADTVVVVDNELLGKPADRAEGVAMLARLSGRSHVVLSAVALVEGEKSKVAVDASRVWFREIDPQECDAYWETGEPADKAGAYAVQGIGAVFIKRLEGSFSGVMGLPLFATSRLLAEFGHTLPGLTRTNTHE